MKDKHSLVSEMSDSEFVSFLYSERDRENNLSQFQGWNNWAIAGALATIIYNIFTIWRSEIWLSPDIMLYAFNATMALYLFIKAFAVAFKHERGYDLCRVRILREEIPKADLALVVVSATCSAVVATVIGEINTIFWLWIILFVLHLIVIVSGVIYRDKVMPAYYEEVYFHNLRIHSWFVGLVGGTCSLLLVESFKQLSCNILTPDFETGICLALLFILISLLFKINTGNRVVKQFDAIIDRYIYAGVSKEETYRKIQCNRVGYGAMEVCRKEISSIKGAVKIYEEKEAEVNRILEVLSECDCDRDELMTYLDFCDELLKMLNRTLTTSTRLTKHIDDIVKVIPEYSDIEDLSYMVKVGRELSVRMREMLQKVERVIDSINDEIHRRR